MCELTVTETDAGIMIYFGNYSQIKVCLCPTCIKFSLTIINEAIRNHAILLRDAGDEQEARLVESYIQTSTSIDVILANLKILEQQLTQK